MVYESFNGWIAFAKIANTYNLRKRIGILTDNYFPGEISTIEINRIAKLSGKYSDVFAVKQI